MQYFIYLHFFIINEYATDFIGFIKLKKLEKN